MRLVCSGCWLIFKQNNEFGSRVMNHGLRSICLLGSLVALSTMGCDFQSPEFHLNMVQMVSDATPTPPEYQKQIADVLGGMFGTPDEPFALPETGLDIRRLKMAAGAAWTDEKGAVYGLYRKHCVHCHGIDGDGQGPTALFLNPYPRDYRQGVYKFKSTYNPARPTDEDLHHVLVNGIPGTAMPSFSLLAPAEIEALIEYVKYLSMRGQMETALTNYVYNDLGEEDVTDENGDPVLDEEGEPVTKLIPLDPESDEEQRGVIMDISRKSSTVGMGLMNRSSYRQKIPYLRMSMTPRRWLFRRQKDASYSTVLELTV